MKPNVDLARRTEGNLNGRRQLMTVDEAGLPFLMQTLTDLYSDKEGAVIREYPINAVDSHTAAGVPDEPVLITLPTMADPTFVVQDFGTGMSVDEVLGHASKYVWSSKRDTNAETGMLGLGFKSALTYTEQFTLTAVKDGIKTEAVAMRNARDEHGNPTNINGVEILDTSATTEPNGVTIRIPVSDIERFNSKARKFFRFWRSPVLVNGEPPEPLNGDWLDDDVLLTRFNDGIGEERDIIVMGNIPYPASRNISSGVRSMRAVVWVDMPQVDFTPSREALHYTERTNETIETAKRFIDERLFLRAQREIDEAESATEALTLNAKWCSELGIDRRSERQFTYRGRAFPGDHFRFPSPSFHYIIGRNSSRKCGEDWLWLHDLKRTHIVTGFPGKVVSPRHRELLRGFFRDDPDAESPTWKTVPSAYLVPHLDWTKGWIDGPQVHDWKDVEAADRIPLEGGPAKQSTQPKQYEILKPNPSSGGFVKEWTDTAPNTARTIYISPAYRKNDNPYLVNSFCHDYSPPYTLVLLHPRSFGRFKREHPRTLSIEEAIIKEAKALAGRVTPMQQAALTAEGHSLAQSYEALRYVDPANLLDPDLRALLEAIDMSRIAGKHNIRQNWERLKRVAQAYGVSSKMPTLSTDGIEKVAEVLGRYPLLRSITSHPRTTFIEDYLNGQHLLRQQEEA